MSSIAKISSAMEDTTYLEHLLVVAGYLQVVGERVPTVVCASLDRMLSVLIKVCCCCAPNSVSFIVPVAFTAGHEQ